MDKFKQILKELAYNMGGGWKADLINIEETRYCYYRECSIFGCLINKSDTNTPQKIEIGYNLNRNRIYAASVYQNNINYGHKEHWHTHKSLKLSLNNRKVKTAAKRIKDELLDSYSEEVQKGIKAIQQEQEFKEKKEQILYCIKKMIAITPVYHSNKFSIDDIKENAYFSGNYTHELFDISIDKLSMNKFVKIIQILKEDNT